MTAEESHRPSLTEALQALRTLARERGSDGGKTEHDTTGAVIVGGAIRDALLGRPVQEVDIVIPGGAVPGGAEAFAREAAARIGGRTVPIDQRIGVWRLPVVGGHIDLVAMVGDLATDLARRDFTVNALALPLRGLTDAGIAGIERASLIDQHHGLADLDAGILRLPSPDAMQSDPVRALRAARFVAELGWWVETETERAIAAVVAQVPDVAAERVGAELARLFAADASAEGVDLLERTGLLTVCFPELDPGRGLDQRPVHLHDVFQHQIETLRWMDVLLQPAPPDPSDPAAAIWAGLWHGPEWMRTPWGDLRLHFARHGGAMRLAALLHDVGKPATRTLDSAEHTHFYGHPPLGAEMVSTALRRWRFPSAVGDRVALLVDQHLRPGQVTAPGAVPSTRALQRFQKALGDATPDVCWLFLADSLATAGVARLALRWGEYVGHAHQIVTWRPPESAATIRRLVDGRAVMAHTGIGPGPIVGQTLAAVEEAAAVGEVRTPEEALALAAKMVALASAAPFVKDVDRG